MILYVGVIWGGKEEYMNSYLIRKEKPSFLGMIKFLLYIAMEVKMTHHNILLRVWKIQ